MSRRAYRPGQRLRVVVEEFSAAGAVCCVLEGSSEFGVRSSEFELRTEPLARPLLVFGLFPGEIAVVELGERRGEARILELERPHPGRRTPACPRYREPAACPLLGLTEEAQTELKLGMLTRALLQAAVALPADGIQPLLRPAALGYRTKAVFAAGPGPAGLRLGYYSAGSHQLRGGTHCLLHHPGLEPVAQAVERAACQVGLPAYAEQVVAAAAPRAQPPELPSAGPERVGLRFVTIRLSREGGGCILLTCRPTTPKSLVQEVAQLLLRELAGDAWSVWRSDQLGSENAVVGAEPTWLAGAAEPWERVGQVRVPLLAGTFYQVNPAGGDLLVREVALAARATGCRTALDLYCGAGAYALNLAAAGIEVTAVERDTTGVAAGRRAALAEALAVDWIAEDAAEYVARIAHERTWDLVVLNPPRKGTTPALLDGLARLRPRTVVYVSCNVATLARDLALLLPRGYLLQRVQPVDLLPQTAYLETVAVCQRTEAIG